MNAFTKKAAEALQQLPEELQQKAIAYLLEQGEKYRVLKEMLDEGEADIRAGNVSDWDFDEFMVEARLEASRK
jgi:hypothetical protein